MLTKLNKRHEAGFTLIELMIVIAIIGILAAIAIPQFSAYRKRSFDASAQSDLRNAATAQEAYYVDFQTYATGVDTLTGTVFGLYLSEGVTMSATGTASTYTLISNHTSGNKTFTLIGPGGTIQDS